MKILVNSHGGKQHEGIEATIEQAARMALIVGLAVLGIGSVYFVALYLVAN